MRTVALRSQHALHFIENYKPNYNDFAEYITLSLQTDLRKTNYFTTA